jgi:hypothetical protein
MEKIVVMVIILLAISLIQVHSYVQCADFKTMPGPGNDVAYYISGALLEKLSFNEELLQYYNFSRLFASICHQLYSPFVQQASPRWFGCLLFKSKIRAHTKRDGCGRMVLWKRIFQHPGLGTNQMTGITPKKTLKIVLLCHNALREIGLMDYDCISIGTVFL